MNFGEIQTFSGSEWVKSKSKSIKRRLPVTCTLYYTCVFFSLLRILVLTLVYVVAVQSVSLVIFLVTPSTAAYQASLSFTSSWSLHKLMSIELVMPPTISSSVITFSSCLQSFPASKSFPMSQLFPSGGQIIGASASASVLPMNILN